MRSEKIKVAVIEWSDPRMPNTEFRGIENVEASDTWVMITYKNGNLDFYKAKAINEIRCMIEEE